MISVPLHLPRRIATGIRTLLLPLLVVAGLPSLAEAGPKEIEASAKRVERKLDMRVGLARRFWPRR